MTVQTMYGAAQPASVPAMGVAAAGTANQVYFAMANGNLMSFDTTNALTEVHSVAVPGGFGYPEPCRPRPPQWARTATSTWVI